MNRIIFLAFALLIAGCDNRTKVKTTKQEDPFENTINQIIESEATILKLSPYVSQILDTFHESGSPPTDYVKELFSKTVHHASVGENKTRSVVDPLAVLWQPFLGDRKFIEYQLGTESGTFNESKTRFELKVRLEGKIRSETEITGVNALQTIGWTRDNTRRIWEISEWTQHSLNLTPIEDILFSDVTAECIPDAATLEKVSRSAHQQRTLEAIRSATVMDPLAEGLPGFNDWESAWQFPSASVVDYDGDGWDDVYLTDRWTGGMMLRNVDGKFHDATEESGLTVGPNCNCVLFADFDNDGDQDAFVGGSIHDSQFFVNENGTFHRDEFMDKELELVRFVTAGSVADINGDGLLDLYVSTYVSPSGSAFGSEWESKMLPESDRAPFKKLQSNHPFVDRGGPANILFMNVNGKLQRCETDDTLKQWRNSYQSVWHDWDNDGDQDLFVCNDFAPDAFLRNDTVKGSSKPVFKDVTNQLIDPNMMGYSMGGSWGDFDNDGDLDLYVSEMYSKAGKRILKQFAQADRRSVESAQGNFLFRNDGDRFTQVAGQDDSELHVAKVGWSFGGQFADFDNDGWLDLYVPSGFYTAPDEVRVDADL
jgi:hypothetical protein